MSRGGRDTLLVEKAVAPGSAARLRTELGRVTRFGVVGASNTVLTVVMFTVLVALGSPAPVASAVGFVAGAANGWVWNTRWTFAGCGGGAAVVPRYVAVQGGCAGLSAAGVVLARGGGLARLSAEVVIVPVVTLVAYVLSRLVVFRPAV